MSSIPTSPNKGSADNGFAVACDLTFGNEMKRVGIFIALFSLVPFGFSEELIIDQKTKIFADRITRTKTADGDVIVAKGNAIVIQEKGGFSGYKFASVETPILYNIQDNSIKCSGWFYATNGKITHGFGELMSMENRMIFHDDGDVSSSVFGVIIIPHLPGGQKTIDEHRRLIEGAKTLLESRNGKTEPGATGQPATRSKSK